MVHGGYASYHRLMGDGGMALAMLMATQFVTADQRLFNALRDTDYARL